MQTESVVFLAGVAGFNRGDDAIADSLLDVLLKDNRYDKAYVSVIKRGVLKQRDCVAEVFLNRKSLLSHLRLMKAIFNSDLVILGGGSIIQDDILVGFFRGLMAYPLEVVFFAKLFNKKVITAPIGVDDLHTQKGRVIAKIILNLSFKVFVRDQKSLNNAINLIEDKSKVFLSSDPVFAYPDQITDANNTLVLCPALEGVSDNIVVDIHKAVIERFLSKSTLNRCLLLAMDERAHEDSGKIVNIYNAVSSKYLKQIDMIVPTSHLEAASLIRNCKLLFSMRLHAIILGCGYVPIFCLSRGTKTHAICKELDIPFIDLKKALPEAVADEFIDFAQTIDDNQKLRNTLLSTKLKKQEMINRFALFEESIINTVNLK